MRRWFTVALLLGVFAVPAGAIEGLEMGGGGPPEIPVRAYVSHDGVAPGGHLQLAVVYEVPPDHHLQMNGFLYAEPAEGEPFVLGEPVLPPTKTWDDDPVLAGKVVLRYDLALARETPLGERELKLLAGYQACSEKPIYACYQPQDKEVAASVRVVASGTPIQPQFSQYFRGTRPPEAGKTPPSVAPADADFAGGEGQGTVAETDLGETSPPSEEKWLAQAAVPVKETESANLGLQDRLKGKLEGALARGSWIAFFIVFVAGFLTSFTPCVYPMIPITIGFVAGASRGKLSGFILSLFFVLGIAIVYSTLGLVAALGGGMFAAAFQSPVALALIGAVFALMGVSMLGAFDLTLPASLQTKLQTGRRGGIIGAVLMGGMTGLIASPCVGPVLVALLAWVAKVGRPLYGFTLLFTFAVGLGLLFLVLGTFVGVVKSLPKAGRWMEEVKHYFGWIFLALAVFFLRTFLGPTVVAIAYGVLLVLFATHVGAFTPLAAESGKGGRWAKGIGVVLLVFGIGMIVNGLATHYGWREVRVAGGPVSGTGIDTGLNWRTDEEAALADAKATGKPVLIDFTADWCAACHELDERTWVDPKIIKELGRFVLLRLDMTRKSSETQALGQRWGISGLPTVIVLDGTGNEIDRFFGFRPPDQVFPLLKRAA